MIVAIKRTDEWCGGTLVCETSAKDPTQRDNVDPGAIPGHSCG
jgi:hypothetical protein